MSPGAAEQEDSHREGDLFIPLMKLKNTLA